MFLSYDTLGLLDWEVVVMPNWPTLYRSMLGFFEAFVVLEMGAFFITF